MTLIFLQKTKYFFLLTLFGCFLFNSHVFAQEFVPVKYSTVVDIIANPQSYNGKKITVYCGTIEVYSSGNLDCDSGSGRYISIDVQSILSRDVYRNLLQKNSHSNKCLTTTVRLDRGKPLFTDTSFPQSLWSISNGCYQMVSSTQPSTPSPSTPSPRDQYNGLNVQWVGKKLYVHNMEVSDENGYRTVGNAKLADLKDIFRAAGIADETLKLRDDPKKKYGHYGYDEIK